ncbi:DUF2283 domain-containing protein [Nocardia sp. NPDC057030]|uniref:DUF2283 domain-containing protein n=1 Tax=Nocardia sp. NPDC057030 TaxID=3346005 RepID=UPI0036256024
MNLLIRNYNDDKDLIMQSDYVDYLTWDEQHNVAYLALRPNNSGTRRVARTLQVCDEAGNEVVAALDFGADGELMGIELLNAATQLGAALKAAAREQQANT